MILVVFFLYFLFLIFAKHFLIFFGLQLPLSLLKSAQGHPMVRVSSLYWKYYSLWMDMDLYFIMLLDIVLWLVIRNLKLLCVLTVGRTEKWWDLQRAFGQLWYLDEHSSPGSHLHLQSNNFFLSFDPLFCLIHFTFVLWSVFFLTY